MNAPTKIVKGVTIVMPIITLGGTSAQDLLYQRQNAAQGVRDAIGHLNEACPHMRDYQIDPAAYDLAIHQHEARLRKLESVLDEIEAEMEHIAPFVK